MSRERLTIEEFQALIDLLSYPKRKPETLRAAAAVGTLPKVISQECDPISEYDWRIELDEGNTVLFETNHPDWRDRLVHCVFYIGKKPTSAFFLTARAATSKGYYQAIGELPNYFREALVRTPDEELWKSTLVVPVPFDADPEAFRKTWMSAVCAPSAEAIRQWFERNKNKFKPKQAERWEAMVSQLRDA